jgi:hypothetical protein
MIRHKKRILGFGLAATGFFLIALLVAGAAMGGDGGMADDRIANLSGSEGGSGGALVAASVSSILNYQGVLTDSDGNPLNGTYTMNFKLYDVPSEGADLETDTHMVASTNGMFNTYLDFNQSYFDGRALWLGIQVGSDPEMTPRQELRPVPYALSLVPEARIEGDGADPVITVINHGLGTGIQAQGAAIGLEATGMTGIKGEGDLGVWGTGNLGSGIIGTVTGTSNVNPGVLGENPNYDGVGVEGQAGFGTGVKGQGEIGVYGQSSVGPGVYGRGGPYGVHGYSINGAGVYGTSDTSNGMYGTTTSTIGHGVHGEVAGSAAIGVYGKSSGSNGQGVAGHGTGNSGTGVYGNGTSVGVQGWSEFGTGVMGGGASNGVWGVSTAGSGLRGQGGQYGVYGSSENGMGVFGSASGLKNKAPAVYGRHQGVGPGVEGYSQEGYGVQGESATSYGVYGNATGTGASIHGVYGETHGNLGWASGVYGNASKNYACGVTGRNTGAGAGVYGWSTTGPGMVADTERPDHQYGVLTLDYMYAARYDSPTTDVAEYFTVKEEVESGTVMIIGTTGILESASKPYDNRVAGIISTAPGMALGTKGEGNEGDEQLIAVAGRVPCKVAATCAPIKPGDLLTTSATRGHAMKAATPQIGTILGKALEPLESGTGVIEVLVTLQ